MNNIKNSFYLKKIKNNKNLIFFSLVLAVLCTLITYPGIWYSDSYGRYNMALSIGKSIKMILNGQRNLINISSWLTIVPSFFMEFFNSNAPWSAASANFILNFPFFLNYKNI